MRPCPVLLTRPMADARRMAAELRAVGADRIEISPLLRIEPTGSVPEISDGLLLTSTNALTALDGRIDLRGRPAWVVGPRTAETARALGLDVRATARDVDALAAAVPDDAPSLTHLRGEVTRGDLVARLRQRGLIVTDAVVYRQMPIPLTDAARALLRAGPTLVPLFSPRSATLLAQSVPHGAEPHLRLLALSDAVAAQCPVRPIGISETPDGPGMIALVKYHLRQIGG